jgi:hypothetical protein
MRGDGSSRAAIGHLIHVGKEIRSFPCVQSKILGTCRSDIATGGERNALSSAILPRYVR